MRNIGLFLSGFFQVLFSFIFCCLLGAGFFGVLFLFIRFTWQTVLGAVVLAAIGSGMNEIYENRR